MALWWSICHWLCSLFHSSWQDYYGTVVKSFQCRKSCSDSVHRTVIGSKPDAAWTHVQSFWYVLQARKTLNSRRSLFQFDQLHVAHLVDSATWFFTEDHVTFSTNRYQLFNDFFRRFFILIKPWDTPSTRRSISNGGFFLNSWLKIPYESPCSSRHIITNKLLLLRMRWAFQSDFWSGSWGSASSEQYSISVCRDHSIDAICGHQTMHDDCMWLRLPELQSLILCSG